ncbi:MAG: glycosyltransferase family 2 protein [Candidatus Zipacnadales bacterium]
MTAQPVQISLCIVSWNVRDDLVGCLDSLRDASRGVRTEVIVVDNASTDDTVAVIRERFPEVLLICNDRNRGFAAATNQAMAEARGQYLLLLNPDTLLPPNVLAELLAVAEAHPEAGILAPKLLNPDGSLQYSCRRFPTIMAAMFRHTLLGRLFPRNRWAAEYIMEEWAHEGVQEVDWVSGACMLVRRELYERIGPLDEGFFWGSEDVDYAYRCHAAGYRVLYTSRPAIIHAVGRSSDQVPIRTVANFHRSMLRLYRKHKAHTVLDYGLVALGIVIRAGLLIVSIGARYLYGRLCQLWGRWRGRPQ